MNNTCDNTIGGFRFALTDLPIDAPPPYPLTEKGVIRLGALGTAIRAITMTYGSAVSLPYIEKNYIHIDFIRNDQCNINPLQDLEMAAVELVNNAALDAPKIHKVAVTKSDLVPVLRAIACGNQKTGIEPFFFSNGDLCPVPILDLADLTEPVCAELVQKAVTMLIVGIRLDFDRGHRLILSGNDINVRLPVGNQEFSWDRMKEALGKSAYYDGLIARTGGGEWQAVDGASLIVQGQYEFSDAAESPETSCA